MNETRVQLVGMGMLLLWVGCLLGFLSFVSTTYGEPPRWPGVLFLGTALYSVVFFRELTIKARMRRGEETPRPGLHLAMGMIPPSYVPPSVAPFLAALIFGGFGIAMLLA